MTIFVTRLLGIYRNKNTSKIFQIQWIGISTLQIDNTRSYLLHLRLFYFPHQSVGNMDMVLTYYGIKK